MAQHRTAQHIARHSTAQHRITPHQTISVENKVIVPVTKWRAPSAVIRKREQSKCMLKCMRSEKGIRRVNSICTMTSFDHNYQNALRQAIVFSIFSFMKNRSYVTQIYITKIVTKCILVFVVKKRDHTNVFTVILETARYCQRQDESSD